MPGTARPWSVPLLLGALLVSFACKRPETALREHAPQRVELVQTVEGMTPEEAAKVEAQLAEGLGCAAPAAELPAGPYRVLRLTLKGGPNSAEHWGLGKTMAASSGMGVLAGLLLVTWPAIPGTTWEVVAISAGLGGMAGFVYGPTQYRHNQAQLQTLGYLPWTLRGELEVLDRAPVAQETVAARNRALNPPLGPYLRPLAPDQRTPAEVRQATLQAYVAALIEKLKRAG